MEGLAAFSLACNIIQVVDFASKVVSVIYKTYKTGATEENISLEHTSKHLLGLSKNLSTSLHCGQGQPSIASAQFELQILASECVKIAEKLQDELNYLKSKGGRRERLRKSWYAIRKKDDIKRLEKSLHDQETLLNTGLLLRVRDQNNAAAAVQKANFESLDKTLQQFISGLANGHTRVSDIFQSENATTRQLIGQEHATTRTHLEKKLTDLRFETITEDQRLRFLNSLSYEEMNGRKNQISATYPETFGWIFDQTAQRPWPSFTKWLEQGSGVYWIQGKAGSGKSTLMKFIINDKRTKEALKAWSPPKDPVILSFFFWLHGAPMQSNLHGLLSSLLHQLLKGHAPMTNQLLREEIYLRDKVYVQDWDVQELSELLQTVARQLAEGRPLCIFLDGLDEYERNANPRQLLDLIHDLSLEKNIKLCVSSRLEQHISNELDRNRFLRLQDLTKADIWKYVSGELGKVYHGGDLSVSVSAQKKLIEEIVSKADGVFLWVSLALHDVLRGLPQHDTFDELLHRVSRLPIDIERLYEDMLQRLGEDEQLNRQEAALYFKTYLLVNKPMPITYPGGATLIYYVFSVRKLIQNLPSLPSSDVDLHDLLRQCHRTKLRIASCCAGMLQITKSFPEMETDDSDGYGAVELFTSDVLQRIRLCLGRKVSTSHRTVLDFLLEKPAGQKILACCPADDVAIFCTMVETLLMAYSAGIRDKPSSLQVRNLLLGIAQCHVHGPAIPEAELCKLLRSIEDTLRMIYASSTKSSDEKVHRWEFDLVKDGKNLAIDFMGLTLEVGLPQYFEDDLSRMLPKAPHSGKTMNANYKSYLLLCASSFSERCVKVLERLLEAGADPNATFYLPLRFPSKHSPWITLLSQGNFKRQEDIVNRFLASGASLQELAVIQYDISKEGWGRAKRFSSLSAFSATTNILVELNAVCLLRDYLEYAKEQACLLQHPTVIEVPTHRRVLLIRPSSERQRATLTSEEDSESLLAMMDELLPPREGVFGPGLSNASSEDKKGKTRSIASKIIAKVEELHERSDKVDLLEFLERKGYYKHPDNLVVLQGPMQRFEDLTEKPDEV